MTAMLKGSNRFVASFLLLGIAAAMQAQIITGDIVGTVKDASGAVVPGATITVTNLGTGLARTVRSAADGDFDVTTLPPGGYSVVITAAGFKTFEVANLPVATGAHMRADASLQLGETSETVEVQTSTPLLQTDDSTVASTISQKTIEEVPLNGRNITNLIANQAGVNTGIPGGITTGVRPDDRRQTSSISANGQLTYFNSTYLDGIDNNERFYGLGGIKPSIDAIQEVKVDTNNYPAEEGRAAGAVISYLTKSGTNQFHGSLYEYFRNDIFDTKDWFLPQGQRKPEYRQNQFGGSIGGPIFKNKTFFFFDLEEFRAVQGVTSPEQEVPSANDHATVAALPQNQNTAVFNLYPLPNVAGFDAVDCGATATSAPCYYVSTPKRSQFITTLDAKIDHHFGANDTMFARYSYNPVTTTLSCYFPLVDGFCPGGGQFIANGAFPGANATTVQGGQINYVHVFSSKLVAELRTGFLRLNIDSEPAGEGTNAAQKLGIVGADLPGTDPRASGLTAFHFLDGHADLGDQIAYPIQNVQNTFQWNGDLIYNTGPHNFKFGAAFIRRQVNYLQEFEPEGWLFFLSPLAMAENVPAVVLFRQNQYSREYLRSSEPTVFSEDTWRVRSNFTLNLGLRYDIYTPFSEAKNRYSNFNLNTLSLDLGGTGGIQTDYGDIAPRFGFSWEARRDTVVRGGFGISYYPGDFGNSVTVSNPPYSNAISCSPIAGTCGMNAAGQPLGLLTTGIPLSPAYVDPSIIYSASANGLSLVSKQQNWRAAYLEQFNLTVQQEFGQNALTIAYVGNLGRRQEPGTGQAVNLPFPSANGTYQVVNGSVPRAYATQLPGISNITLFANEFNSNYNSLQATFQRRFNKGLSYNVNYTWAHSLNNWSGQDNNGNGEDWRGNDRYNYGNSELDVRNRAAAQLVWNIPAGDNLNGPVAVLAKGWTLSANAFIQTGLPFTVVDSSKPGGAFQDFNTSIKVNVVPGVSYYAPHKGPFGFLNPAAFSPAWTGSSTATTFTLGNEGTNQVFGPHLRQADLAVVKNQTLHDNLALQFRVECFNVTNTENFNQPLNDLNSPGTFGQITSTAPGFAGREFQFALRATF